MRKTIDVEYHDDPIAIYATAGPIWRQRGRDVYVLTPGGRIPYFDFVIQTRQNDKEPAAEIARFILTRRKLERTYVGPSKAMVRQLSKAIGRPIAVVRWWVASFARQLDEGQ